MTDAAKQARRDYQKKWRENNRDRLREYHRKWNAENPDKVRESARKWRKSNPDKVRKYNEDYWSRKAERLTH